jgi:4,5-DOPA dioxygenase extradiol
MPALFVGHGSPMNALEDNRHTRVWKNLGETLPRPAGIVAISAHWYTSGAGVTAVPQPKTIHDFYGFPPPLFAVNYPAPGDPALAARVQEVLRPIAVTADQQWGLDHGTWSVLAHIYPRADVPVVQLSIDATQPPQYHYDVGRKLAALRDEGVLIFGSGNVVHNLGVIKWNAGAGAYPWAERFNEQLRDALRSGDHEFAIRYERAGQPAAMSIPSPEHYLPLLYVLGAMSPQETISFPTDGIELGSISMLAVLTGS